MNDSWMIYQPEPPVGPLQFRLDLEALDRQIAKIESQLAETDPAPHPFVKNTLTVALAELNRKRRVMAIDAHEIHRSSEVLEPL
jgi:hypothetical protein